MSELNPLQSQEELDIALSENRVHLVWTNVYIAGERHCVVSVDDHYHSSGGGFGDNKYYAYPANVDGARTDFNEYCEFGGHVLCWGIKTEMINTHKTKWGSTRIDRRYETYITLNGEEFLLVSGSMEYALPKAQQLIIELSEGIIDFTKVNWKTDLIGMKVYYRDQPAIITAVGSDLNLTMVPDGIDKFTMPAWMMEESSDDGGMDVSDWDGSEAVVSYFSDNITWFRKK
jgi:hypothetical protein